MRPHVLLVDDDTAARTALTKLLCQFEYLCTAVASYEEARSVLREYTPDILITDVRLGTHNGLHLLVGSPEIPAIVITGFDDPVLRKEAERMGAVYLVKPVPARDLLDVIAQRLQKRP